MPPLLQEQLADVVEVVNDVTCTQIPPAISKGALKRARKPVPSLATDGGGTAPKTPRRSASKMVAMASSGMADLRDQTPMPQSDQESEFGPPPPDTTPTPLRENSASSYELINSFCCDVCICPDVYPESSYISQVDNGVFPGGDRGRRKERWLSQSPGSSGHGCPPQSCLT